MHKKMNLGQKLLFSHLGQFLLNKNVEKKWILSDSVGEAIVKIRLETKEDEYLFFLGDSFFFFLFLD